MATHYEMKGKKVHYGILDEQFSEYSYGLRPKRYAVMAITKAIELMNDGNDLVDLIHSKMKGFINKKTYNKNFL